MGSIRTRRWLPTTTIAGSVFLWVGAFLYIYDWSWYSGTLAGISFNTLLVAATTWLPAFAGSMGLLALVCGTTPKKMLLLLAGPCTLSLLMIWALTCFGDPYPFLSHVALGAGIASGGHFLLRRSPERRLPRVLLGLGGGSLIAAFTAPLTSLGSRIHWITVDLFRPAYLLDLMLLVYGLISASLLAAQGLPRFRCAAMIVLERLLLLGLPAVIVLQTATAVYEWRVTPGSSPDLAPAKIGLLGLGYALLIAAAVVAVFEGSLEASRTVDPAAPTA